MARIYGFGLSCVHSMVCGFVGIAVSPNGTQSVCPVTEQHQPIAAVCKLAFNPLI